MPPNIAIVGRPNVGKSTLFNRLLGKRKAIVDDEPGVTRDRLFGSTLWNNRPITLIDTGGLDPSERRGLLGLVQAQTTKAIQEADAIICLFDGREGLLPLDKEISLLLRKTKNPVFYAVNKIDTKKLEDLTADFYSLGMDRVFPISAETGLGIQELMDEILKTLPQDGGQFSGITGEHKVFARVSIVGRPNVGKSTLLNRLLGEERAIVDEAPGTTRDSLDTLIKKGPKIYLLVDTAGIRRRAKLRKGIEFYGVRRAFQAIERSDISLLLIDAVEGPTSQDLTLLSHILKEKKACLFIVNKWDVLREEGAKKKDILSFLRSRHQYLPFIPIHIISALTGEGVQGLFSSIESVMEEYRKRVPTSLLNSVIGKAVKAVPPPAFKGKAVRLYYSTQISVAPPTIVIFCNYPEAIRDGYRRYLEVSLRKKFPFTGCPLELVFREKR